MNTKTNNTQLAVRIEPFDYESEQDYADAVAINNRIFELYPETVAEWKHHDKLRQPRYYYGRYMVKRQDTGESVGFGVVMHMPWAHHPDRYDLLVYVEPDLWGQGVRSQLYDFLFEQIAPRNPIWLEMETMGSISSMIEFIEARGYEVKTREYSSQLDLTTFDPSRFETQVEAVLASDIVVKTWAEAVATVPDFFPKLYDAGWEIEQDIPYHHEMTRKPYDEWLKRIKTHPNRIDDLYLVAFDQDEIAGLTMLFRSEATDEKLFTGLTGVRRAYRRRGIATALKVMAFNKVLNKPVYRDSNGNLPLIITENEENNPMFAINETLGFTRLPDWLCYNKQLREAPEQAAEVAQATTEGG